MSTNHMDVTSTEGTGCPHSHKASLVLENGELAGDFLSRHFESCKVCNSKLSKLKNERKFFLKQIPFVSTPSEVKQIFEAESDEFESKIKRRVFQLKKKKVREVNKHVWGFFFDLKDAVLSKPVILSLFVVFAVWSCINFL